MQPQSKEPAITELKQVSLGLWPTPVHRIPRFEQHIGSEEPIFMKREDLCGVGAGGNKVRSLEALIGEALRQGADTLIASGPLQSNLCSLAAACGAKRGIPVHVVHNAAKPEKRTANVLLNWLAGAESHYIGAGTDEWQRGDYVEALAEKMRGEGKKPFVIYIGGSSGIGALGYANMMEELYNQWKEQNLPFKHVFISGGGGGVASGVVYGNWKLGMPFQVHVISVEYPVPEMEKEMERIFKEAKDYCGVGPDVPVGQLCHMDDAYLGGGWSHNTPESEAMALLFPKLEGVFIENVYTSKVLVAIEDYAKQGKIPGGACYIHTGGFGSLFAQYE